MTRRRTCRLHQRRCPAPLRSSPRRSYRPVMHSGRGHSTWVGDVVCDAFDQHAPADASVCIPPIDFETDMSARRELKLGSWRGAKRDDTLVKEVVDREDERTDILINYRDAAEVVCPQEPDAFRLIQNLELPRARFVHQAARCRDCPIATVCPARS